MKVKVRVSAYVSTVAELELPDTFDVTDMDSIENLAYNELIQSRLMDNAEDCIKANSEIEYVQQIDENGKFTKSIYSRY